MNFGASAYFSDLHSRLLAAEVTDNEGRNLGFDDGCNKFIEALLSLQAAEGVVILIGNGGSAAIAEHTYSDLSMSCGIRSVVFTITPSLTAVANDFGYDSVFEKPIAKWADGNSALIAISSSGQSSNILRAVKLAREQGAAVYTFSGFRSDNALRRTGVLNFWIDSLSYGVVEIAHASIAQFITDAVSSRVSERERT